MRIALCSTLPPFRGGIAQFNARLVEELRKEHDVSTFTWSRQYPKLLFPGTDQRETDSTGDALPVLDSIAPWTWSSTVRSIAATKPDLAIVRYWTPFLSPATAAVARGLRKRNIPVLGIVDNILPHESHFYDKALARHFLASVDRVLTLSEAVRDQVSALAPTLEVHVSPHPFYDHFGEGMPRAEACERLGIPPSGKNLLFFGLIRPYKGLDILLDAFRSLDPHYRLIIAGENYGDERALRESIQGHPCRERILLHDHFIPEDQVPVYFSAADAVVLPYRSATQSGVTAVAFQFDVPVVATDVGGLRDTVIDERTGMLVAHPSSELVAKAIERLFTLGKEHFKPGIAEMRQSRSWSRFAQAVVAR